MQPAFVALDPDEYAQLAPALAGHGYQLVHQVEHPGLGLVYRVFARRSLTPAVRPGAFVKLERRSTRETHHEISSAGSLILALLAGFAPAKSNAADPPIRTVGP